MKEARQKYLDFLAEHCGMLSPRGINQTVKSVSLPLDQIYVSLTAQREQTYHYRMLEIDSAELGGAPVTSGIMRGYDSSSKTRVTQEKVDLPRAVRENARLVFLGDPGAGKTTLTRFLAARFAQAVRDGSAVVTDAEGREYGSPALPVLLRVADYAAAFRTNRNLSLRDFLHTPFGDAPISPDTLQALFQQALDDGQAFVLLDGLDEIAEAGDRIDIAKRLDSFAMGLGMGSRILVTSRVAGYAEARLGGAFSQYTLREMDRAEMETFLRRWCVAAERFHTPDAAEAAIQQRAQVESDSLLQGIDDNPGVQRLAKNPLLLTILALIHRNNTRLPQRRIELYELASQTLLRDWRLAQAGAQARTVEEWEAEELLGPLAYWMHENEPTGLIDDKDAKDQLRRLLAVARDRKPSDPDIRAAVDDFLTRVREQTGLFVERAPGRYGFMHLTFEEYFAAREMVSDFTEAPPRLQAHRHQSRWEEPIRLAIASERPKNAATLIRTALWSPADKAASTGYEPSAYEEYLHRDLLLAARCLGDCVGAEGALAREVAAELVSLLLDYKGRGRYDGLYQRILDTLPQLNGSEAGTEVARLLVNALTQTEWTVRERTLEAFGRLGHATPEIIHAIRESLDDTNWDNYFLALRVLWKLGEDKEEITRTVLEELKNDKPVPRAAAAKALGLLRLATPEVTAALVTALADQEWTVRSDAAQALGELGQATPQIIDALVAALQDEDGMVQGRAAGALGQLGKATQEVISALSVVLGKTTKGDSISVAATLGQLAKTNPEVTTMLIPMLRDENGDIRFYTVFALGQIVRATTEVTDALLVALQDEFDRIRVYAAYYLGRLEETTPKVTVALITALDDEDKNVRFYAADALVKMRQITPEVTATLVASGQSLDIYVRIAAAEALGKIGQATPEVLETVVAIIQHDNRFDASEAWETLWRLLSTEDTPPNDEAM